MPLPAPITYTPHDYMADYNQGAKAVQDTVDSFYHNADLSLGLQEARRRQQLQAQLDPLKVREQQYRVANLAPMTPAVDPADAEDGNSPANDAAQPAPAPAFQRPLPGQGQDMGPFGFSPRLGMPAPAPAPAAASDDSLPANPDAGGVGRSLLLGPGIEPHPLFGFIGRTAAKAASSSPQAANALAQKAAAAAAPAGPTSPQIFDMMPGGYIGRHQFIANPKSRQYLPVPHVSRAQQSEDRQLVANAGRMGINPADYPTDAAGNLMPEGRQQLQAAYAAARAKTASGSGALSLNQQLNHEERAAKLADNLHRFNADLKTATGHDFHEFAATAPEFTRQEQGGVAYYLGNGPDIQSRTRVFLPQEDYEGYINRYNSLKAANPRLITPRGLMNAAPGRSSAAAGQTTSKAATASAPTGSPSASGYEAGSILEEARAAIQAGADPQMVKDRLEANGIDSGGL